MTRTISRVCWGSAAAALVLGLAWLVLYIARLQPGDPFYRETITIAALLFGGATIVLMLALAGFALLFDPSAQRSRSVYLVILGVTALLLGTLFGGVIGIATLFASAWSFVLAHRRFARVAAQRACLAGAAIAVALAVYAIIGPL